jgi:hemerythrin
MKRFEMTEDLLTGVEDIDEQHRTLLDLGNRVINPSAYKTDGAIFEDALKFLADYVIYHFAAEEYAMIESHFPNYEHHRQWHERFKKEVSDYVNRAQKEGMSKDLKLKVSFAIEDWLLGHIRITDGSLAKFLQQQKGGTPMHLPSVRALKDMGKLPAELNEMSAAAKQTE